MTRVLGAIRLSRYSGEEDPSTSPERQRATIEAAGVGEVVGWASDLDVSATTKSPFDRPELGEWLRHPERYDAICWARLDRAVRSMGDLHDLATWATTHHKALIFVSGPGGQRMTLDFRSGALDPMTKFVVLVLAFAAEMEAYAIRERILDMKLNHRSTGRHSGGTTPWWTDAVDNSDGPGKTLVLNPERAAVMRELIDRVVSGESQASIYRDFNTRAVGGKTNWKRVNTYRMLRNPALVGVMTHDGQPIRDGDGFPVRRGEALLSKTEFDRLQRVLEGNKSGPSRDNRVNLLTGVVFCALCGAPRHYRSQTIRGNFYSYSRCRSAQEYTKNETGWCRSLQLRADDLERYAERAFLDLFGQHPVMRTEYHPAVDHSDEIEELEAALNDLLSRVEGKPASVAAVYESRITKHEARLAELATIPAQPERVVRVPTGETYGDIWARSTIPERRALLVEGGFRIEAAPGGDAEKAEAATRMAEAYRRLADDPDCGELLGHSYASAPFVLLIRYPAELRLS